MINIREVNVVNAKSFYFVVSLGKKNIFEELKKVVEISYICSILKQINKKVSTLINK